ncbi:polysaccharide deacetylase family protein [Cyclobacterium sp.]|uniref:polysaccharide deacetylase family protein n=1 Tax=Cyclobacterium sp. TaxID=1966343 RepID=UPI0019AD92E8|nr:polysaccharide deacetylase family protein [Cyclobacterium sp.]MBD3627580.1 polysaccharide deacetylase family protein [Cyclobacterium sp.]
MSETTVIRISRMIGGSADKIQDFVAKQVNDIPESSNPAKLIAKDSSGSNVQVPYSALYSLIKSSLDTIYRNIADSYTKTEVDGLVAAGIKDIQPASADDAIAGIKFPTESGTYTNYGGTVVDLTEGLTMIFSDGAGGFTKSVVPIELGGYPTLEKVGIVTIPQNTDILDEISQTPLSDTEAWGEGFLNSIGLAQNSVDYKYSKEYIRAYPGDYDGYVLIQGNASIVAYDENYGFLQSIQNPTDPLSYDFNFTLPEGTKWVRISHLISFSPDNIQGKIMQSVEDITPSIFSTPFDVSKKIIESRFSLGINIVPENTDILESISESTLTDSVKWGLGFLTSTGTISLGGTGWYYSKEYIKAYPGTYDSKVVIYGSACLIAYDKGYNQIAFIQNPTDPVSYDFNFNLPEGTAWIRLSHNEAQSVSIISARITADTEVVNDVVFSTPSFVEYKVQTAKEEISVEQAEKLKKFGFTVVPENTNAIEELTNSLLTDTEIWGSGFLHKSTGLVVPDQPNWYYSKNYYRVGEGSYRLICRFTGNAGCLVYDENYSWIQSIESATSLFNGDVTLVEHARYFRVSYNSTQANLPGIKLSNNAEMYLTDGITSTTDGISSANTSIPVNGFAVANLTKQTYKLSHPAKTKKPIVSFIADDGRWGDNEWYIPILDSKNIKSTFAIVTGWMTGEISVADAHVEARVRELFDLGHDIAGHTHTHENMVTTIIDLSEVEQNLHRSKSALKNIDVDCPMFVPPFGGRNNDVDKKIRSYFDASFVSVADSEVAAGTCVNTPVIDSYNLKRVKFDASENGVSRLQLCKDAVDVAISTGGWLVFAVHPAYTEYRDSNPDYLNRRAELGLLIDYIKSLDVSILTAKQAFNFYKNPVQIGNYRLDAEFYELGMDGSERGNLFD